MRTPEFFIVGAAKSGTSALQDYLVQHPDVCMPAVKEIHHFAPDILRANDSLLDRGRYLSLFEHCGNESICGEASAFYLISEVAAAGIHEFFPKAKIVVILRDPLEMVYSLHSQLVYNGEEDIREFSKAWQESYDRRRGLKMPEHTRILRKHIYTDVAKYRAQVQRFVSTFPRDQVKIFLYEDLRENPLAVVQEMYRFIGVRDDFVPNVTVVNANKRARFSNVARLLARRPKWLGNGLDFLIGKQAKKRVAAQMRRLNTVYVKREAMDPATREAVATEYRDDVLALEKLIGRDLGRWCRI